MNVLVKWPTRSRPDIFAASLAIWQSDPTVRFLITIDDDDPFCNNEQFTNFLNLQHNVCYEISSSKSKIEAINSGVANAKWSLIIVGSDDMIPQRPDYAQHIADLFKKWFPYGDGVLHLNDGRTGAALNTLPIMDRKYFNRFGYVYNENYVSLFADNELTEVSKANGRSVYVNETIIKHAWTDVTGKDELHKRNESYYEQDHQVYLNRRAAGFPVGSVAIVSGKETHNARP